MRTPLTILLSVGCAAAHGAPPLDVAPLDVAPLDAETLTGTGEAEDPGPCPTGWAHESGDTCARWRFVAPLPEACDGAARGVAMGLHGGALLTCGELGFIYDGSHDTWYETDYWPEAPGDWNPTLPPPDAPSDQRLSAPLWGDDGLLVLTFSPWAVPWSAARWDPMTERMTDTLDPPAYLQPHVAYTIGLGQVMAVGIDAALYEITAAP